MDITPFTHEEAIDIAEDFEDLIDTDFDLNGAVYEVIDVVVCPFPEGAGIKFIDDFQLSKDKESALVAYVGEEFNVLVYAINIDNQEQTTFIDIRTFAEQKGIRYNYPGKA